jgi:hypothetical protein
MKAKMICLTKEEKRQVEQWAKDEINLCKISLSGHKVENWIKRVFEEKIRVSKSILKKLSFYKEIKIIK